MSKNRHTTINQRIIKSLMYKNLYGYLYALLHLILGCSFVQETD